jgi:hypothetical protein
MNNDKNDRKKSKRVSLLVEKFEEKKPQDEGNPRLKPKEEKRKSTGSRVVAPAWLNDSPVYGKMEMKQIWKDQEKENRERVKTDEQTGRWPYLYDLNSVSAALG